MGQADQVDAGPAAGRTGDDLRTAALHAEGAQNILRRRNLLHRVGSQRHPDGIADSVQQQRANAD